MKEDVVAAIFIIEFKGTILRLSRFLPTESPFKIIRNTFYFTLKSLFALKIFEFLP